MNFNVVILTIFTLKKRNTVQRINIICIISNENVANDKITLTEKKVDPKVCMGVKKAYEQFSV